MYPLIDLRRTSSSSNWQTKTSLPGLQRSQDPPQKFRNSNFVQNHWVTAPILRQTRLDGREPRRNCSVGDQRSQLTALNGRDGLTMLPHPSQHPLTPSTRHNLTFAPLLRLTRLWPKPTLAGPAPQRATQCRVRVSGPPMSSRSDRPTECFKARF